MKVNIYTDASVFDSLADEWDSIVDTSRPETFFIRHDWQRLWWEHLPDGDLVVMTFRDDDQLRGIVPMFHKDGVMNLVGCVDVTDYLDIVALPDDVEAVIEAFLDTMLNDPPVEWRKLDFCNIPAASPTYEVLPRLAESHGLSVSTSVQEVCPVIVLPDDYDDYLANLDKKQRHELRRKRRRGDGGGAGWYVVDDSHDIDAEVEDFLSLMAASHPEKAEFLQEEGHRAFFRALGPTFLADGTLSLQFLTVEDQKVAAMWQFKYGDRMLLYNSGLDPENFGHLSPGIVLLTYSIEDSIAQGMTTYDFLRGDETYKYRMGAEDTEIFQIEVEQG